MSKEIQPVPDIPSGVKPDHDSMPTSALESNSSAEGDGGASDKDYPPPLPFTADPEEDLFVAGASARIRRLIPILGVVFTVAVAMRFGLRVAGGFAVGAVIAALNHRWMEQGIQGLLDRVAETGQKASGTGVFLRFLSRFGLILTAAYVTLSSSRGSLYGFLGGLFLPVAAILCEAGYEATAALRRSR